MMEKIATSIMNDQTSEVGVERGTRRTKQLRLTDVARKNLRLIEDKFPYFFEREVHSNVTTGLSRWHSPVDFPAWSQEWPREEWLNAAKIVGVGTNHPPCD